MARVTVGGTTGDIVTGPGGAGLRTASVLRWYASADGAQLTGLLLNGQSVDEIPVPAGGYFPEHQWPDGVTVAWVAASTTSDGFAYARRYKHVPPGSGGGGGVSSYNDLTDKPSTFPPSAHTQAASSITGLATVATSGSKADVGLGNVDNTADTAKPVSTAQQTALDGKQPLDSDLTAIAALTTTAFGRSLLTQADAAAGRTTLGVSPAPIRFSAATAAVATTGSDRADSARTITQARMRCGTAPVGSALTAIVQHSTDGTSWSDVATLTIAAGSTTEAVSGTLSQVQAVGNLVRLNVTSVGSTTAATGVVVDVVVA